MLLSNVGARGYKLVRSLSQNNPTSKSYDELKKLMLDHMHPKPNEIAQRYVFSTSEIDERVKALRITLPNCVN